MSSLIQLQTEASECALACLANCLNLLGQATTLRELRQRFPISQRGATLAELMRVASAVGLGTRALRLELSELGQLTTPCILHWDLNHFVVLKRGPRRGKVLVIDPAVGERALSLEELSQHFTGVALELTPTADFQAQPVAPKLALSALTGKVRGLKRSLAQVFVLALVLQLFAITAPLLNQWVIDDVLTSGDKQLLTVLVVGFALLLVVQTAIGLARSWMVLVLSQQLSLQWTGNVFAHLVRLPLRYFEQRHLGDISSRFAAVGAIQKTLTHSAIEALLDGLMAIAALAMMLLYAPVLAAVVVAAVFAYAFLRWAAYGPFREAAAQRLAVAARENTHFLETLRGILPLKLFGREQERRSRWLNLVVEIQNRDAQTAKLSIAFSAANAFIFGLENLVVLWLGAKLILAGQTGAAGSGVAAATNLFSVGMLMAFMSYKGQFTGRVSALIDYVVELRMLSLHSERLADIALQPPEKDDQPHSSLAHLEPTLELRGVSFRYSDAEPWILRGANFKMEARESVALVGASGCGKSTLLKVMLGILPPQEGEVLYGGVPLGHLGLGNVRRQIGTVMQEDCLLSGSLADNICFFDPLPNLPRIEACAQAAQISADIARMPMAYQTVVGDLGSGLSGGQKQRLLLARALYKQPKILALDEATSQLDLSNEQAVTAAVAQMNLTRLVIAHRPQTIAGAGRVFKVHEGRVFELPRAPSNLAEANLASMPS